jgi:hypothetical protein
MAKGSGFGSDRRARLLGVLPRSPRSGGGTANPLFPLFFPPTLISLSPSSGTADGGTIVTLTGFNFRTGATVLFNGLAATVTAVTPTHATVTTPAHAAGTVSVTITNTDGQNSVLANSYAYLLPLVVVGQDQAAYSIDDGVTWVIGTIPVGAWASVAWAADRYIAISPQGKSAISFDGKTWAAGGNLPQASGYQVVTSNPAGILVAMRNVITGLFCRSIDGGVTWGDEFSPGAGSGGANNMGWDGSNFVAVLGGASRSSPDGAAWSSPTVASGLGSGALQHTGFVNTGAKIIAPGTFAAVGKAFFSTNSGNAWSNVNSIPWNGNTDYAWNGNIFLIFQHSAGSVATSPDAITWTTLTTVAGLAGTLIWTGKFFLVNRGTGGRSVSRTVDGVSWIDAANAIPAGTGQAWVDMAAQRFRWSS